NPVNATIADGSATGAITNDDKLPHGGHYSGTTAQGETFSFDVSSDGTSLSNLSTTVNFVDCDAPIAAFLGFPFTAAGPVPIGPDRMMSGPVSGGLPGL